MYFKKIRQPILLSALFAAFSAIAGFFVFEIDWRFLPFPLLSGFIVPFFIKGKNAYQYVDKILISSLSYGFLAALFIHTRMYFISNFIFFGDFPFWPIYNPKEYLLFSLVFSFVCLLGGLSGIVIKGFYFMLKKKNQR